MKAKKYWIVVGLVMVICLFAYSVTEDKEALSSLAGLKGIYVMVEPLPEWTKQYGLTKNEIQTKVELRLRQDGIRVLSKEKSDQFMGRAFLYVNINAQFYEVRKECPVSFSLSICQDVYLARERDKFIGGAATWHIGSVGLCSTVQLPKFVKISIDSLIDHFINDYLAANPKLESAGQK